MAGMKKIDVSEDNGIFRVAAEFEKGFNLIPSPFGRFKLAFWDEQRLTLYLKEFGFYPEIDRGSN